MNLVIKIWYNTTKRRIRYKGNLECIVEKNWVNEGGFLHHKLRRFVGTGHCNYSPYKHRDDTESSKFQLKFIILFTRDCTPKKKFEQGEGKIGKKRPEW